ncbi:hypothetical protein [Segetibacter aerophilus]|uniref:Peptidase S74 domain-containing protein n=1 Tax=Segetibacter aerophilus TaxID=670293 RepID=A0A512BIX6_9BACT|nr:hypothetical protein [Segetibacter aerophilus]GEO11767.1 hypothetical protein SAE01_42630 [Segetibacter aerophilus]
MKKVSVLLVLVILFGAGTYAQSVPQGMKYQAVARNLAGGVIASQEISLKISLLSKGSNPSVYYTEVHTVTTNQLGLFNLVVGGGKVEKGSFQTIPWSTDDVWLQVALKDKGKADFAPISSSQLFAVPYAFHAATASELVSKGKSEQNYVSAAGAASPTSVQAGVPSANWSLKGNSKSDATVDKLGTTDYEDLIFVTNNLERLRITKEGDISIANSLKVGVNVEVGNDLIVKKNVFLNTISGSTTNNGTFTVANAKSTSLTGTLTTDGATVLKNTLSVDGAAALKNTLAVDGATSLKSTLTTDGATSFKSTLTTDGATSLKSTLTTDGATALKSTLIVTGATTLNNTLNANGQVTVNADLANSQDDYNSYPLRVQGNEQGLAIKLNASAPDRGNNFITFYNSGGAALGRVEGFSGIAGGLRSAVIGIIGDPGPDDVSTDKNQAVSGNIPGSAADYFGTNYAFGAYSLTLTLVDDIVRLIVNAAACAAGLGIAGDCDDVAWSVVDLVVGGLQLGGYIAYNEAGGASVAYESGGADYAEWLHKFDTTETFSYGDVVGVKGGLISKSFKDAEKFMVISHLPAMVGGMPNPDKLNEYEKVAFLGQIPVKVVGHVKKGDYILPSGNDDGMALAVAPAQMKTRDYQRIIGISWAEADSNKVFNYINTAVGINSNDMANTIQDMQVVINNMQTALTKLKPDFKPNYFDTRGNTVFNQKGYSKSPTLKETVTNNIIHGNHQDLKETLKEAKKYAEAQGFDLKQYPYLSQMFDNPTPETMQKAYDHYSKVLVKAKNQLEEMKKVKQTNTKS